jgi:hypothetical protein
MMSSVQTALGAQQTDHFKAGIPSEHCWENQSTMRVKHHAHFTCVSSSSQALGGALTTALAIANASASNATAAAVEP